MSDNPNADRIVATEAAISKVFDHLVETADVSIADLAKAVTNYFLNKGVLVRTTLPDSASSGGGDPLDAVRQRTFKIRSPLAAPKPASIEVAEPGLTVADNSYAIAEKPVPKPWEPAE